MMQNAVLSGLVDYLIATISGLTAENCQAMVDERPDPVAKDFFTSVYISNLETTSSSGEENREEYTIGVSISKRIHTDPYDRIAERVYLGDNGIALFEDTIFLALNKRQSPINSIRTNFTAALTPPFDTLISGIDAYGVLQCTSRNNLSFQNEEWFHGTKGGDFRDRSDGNVGMSSIMIFSGLEVRSNPTETCP